MSVRINYHCGVYLINKILIKLGKYYGYDIFDIIAHPRGHVTPLHIHCGAFAQ